jgi:serine/threonine protein kinase
VAVPKARTIIRGRYQLESMIGEGGMASVWRARDLTLARSVAVKLLFARDDRDGSALTARFLREARIAASVQHRNVIQIVDFGTTEDELPFMVMELLEGEPLSGRMHRERLLPVTDVVQIGNLTLRGLSAVHTAGIVHRDLKPDNIYLKLENDAVYPKILDFGISRSVEPASGRRSALTTREGMIIGTPEYMSPEQARGIKNIDPRTDLYSMGVILYEALTGRLPFHSENVGDLIIQVVTGTAPTVHELMPDIPLEISDVIARSMARKREDRFTTAAEMQAALLDAASRMELRSAPRVVSDMPQVEETSGTRRLTPSERATIADQDSLPASGLAAQTNVITLQRTPTTDGFAIVPPVTQTLDAPSLHPTFRLARPRRWALPLMAAAAVVYSTIVLVHARNRDGLESAPARASLPTGPVVSAASSAAPPIELVLPPLAAEMQPSTAEAKRPLAAATKKDASLEVRVAHEPVKPKLEVAKPRTRAKATPAKPKKTQGALRNLDF